MLFNLFKTLSYKQHIVAHLSIGYLYSAVSRMYTDNRLFDYLEVLQTEVKDAFMNNEDVDDDVLTDLDDLLKRFFYDLKELIEDGKNLKPEEDADYEEKIMRCMLSHGILTILSKVQNLSKEETADIINMHSTDYSGIEYFPLAEELAGEAVKDMAKEFGLMTGFKSFHPIQNKANASDICKPKKKVKRRDLSKRHIPNYAYKPKGDLEKYYRKKIGEVMSWKIEGDVNNLNYSLRVLEGWLDQAEQLTNKATINPYDIDNNAYKYSAFSISDNIIWNFPAYYYRERLYDFPKQESRMKNMLKKAHDLFFENFTLSDADKKQVLADYDKLHNYAIYENATLFDLKSFLEDIRKNVC